jgi:FMN reductase
MTILTISGSPSPKSRSAKLLHYIADKLSQHDYSNHHIAVSTLPASALIGRDHQHPDIIDAVVEINQADVVVIATPIYKASYSGLLKTFLDLLPQRSLNNKIVLPIATGGSLAHYLAIDYALRPVLTALGATHVLSSIFGTDQQIKTSEHGTLELDPSLKARLDEVAEQVIALLEHRVLAH